MSESCAVHPASQPKVRGSHFPCGWGLAPPAPGTWGWTCPQQQKWGQRSESAHSAWSVHKVLPLCICVKSLKVTLQRSGEAAELVLVEEGQREEHMWAFPAGGPDDKHRGHAVLFWAFSAYGVCVIDSWKSRTRTSLYDQRTNWGITMAIPCMKCLLYMRQHAQCFSWNISNPQNNLRWDTPSASKLTNKTCAHKVQGE